MSAQQIEHKNSSLHNSNSTAISGNALRFDGSDDYLYILNSASLNPTHEITIEAWVKPDNIMESDQGIVTKTEGSGYNLYLNHHHGVADGRFFFSLYTSSSNNINVETTQYTGSGDWHHVCGTYDGSIMKIYVNGIQKSSYSSEGNIHPSSIPLFIGAEYQEGRIDYFFHGLIDEVRVWNIARSQSQIKSDMHRKLHGNEPGLAGYWDFNEGFGQVLYDRTDNNNDGILGSSPIVDNNDPAWVSSDVPLYYFLQFPIIFKD